MYNEKSIMCNKNKIITLCYSTAQIVRFLILSMLIK